MRLAVFGVPWSEPEEVPALPALLQVVADGVQLVLGPVAGHDAQRRAELRPQLGLYGGRVGGRDDQYRLALAGMEQGDRGGSALQASRLGDWKGPLEPVTQVVPHQSAGRSCPVAFAHDQLVNNHIVR